MSRLLSSTITVRLSEQVYIVGQLLRCVLHLILQLLGLRIAQSFGEPTPYRLKVDGWVMGPNHRKGMSSDGHNSVVVEALEVLPCCLAPVDDGVRTWWPVVGLRSYFHVDVVEHRLDSSGSAPPAPTC